MRVKQIIWAGAAVVLMAATPLSAAAAATKVVVGFNVDVNTIPLHVLVAKGWDKKYGIEVESKGFARASDSHTALRGGALDAIVNMGTNSVALLNQEGGDVKGIRVISLPHFKVLVRKDAPYRTVAYLKGRKMAVTSIAGTSYILTAMALRAINMDPKKDAEIVTGAPATILGLLEKQEVASVTLWEPFVANALKTGMVRVLEDPSKIYKDRYGEDFLHTSLAVSGPFLAKNREAVRSLLKALEEGIQFTLDHPAESNQIAAGPLKMPAEDLADARKSWGDSFLRVGTGETIVQRLNNMYARMHELKILEKPADARQFWVVNP
ncbi:MAG: hypothetical protein A3H39_07340 [candidate division NC10 bacterium RIFCSPLOWO2_02_FULL_66_22]|nr:MAG: hypothetical protein A3H39_07340 [candidate division NC10 bacterium RIFCSPLOWO2_02_FULL_66_22]